MQANGKTSISPMSISFLIDTNSDITGSISTSSAPAFTAYQRSIGSEQTSGAQSSHIFNPATHVVTTHLQERVTHQRQRAQSKTAEKVSSVPLLLPSITPSSQLENHAPYVCEDCQNVLKLQLIKQWEANPTNEELTLMLLPFIYHPVPDWLKAQEICYRALQANPYSIKLLEAEGFIRSRLRDHLLLVTNNRVRIVTSHIRGV